MDIESEIQVLKVQMTYARAEQEELLSQVNKIESKLDDISLLLAKYRGVIGAIMLVGTMMLAGAKMMLSYFYKG